MYPTQPCFFPGLHLQAGNGPSKLACRSHKHLLTLVALLVFFPLFQSKLHFNGQMAFPREGCKIPFSRAPSQTSGDKGSRDMPGRGAPAPGVSPGGGQRGLDKALLT